MALQPCDKLGLYEILAPIGAGGMGEVYKANDTRLDRIVAIRKPGDPHPFVDPASWDARAKRSLETVQRVLAQEQAKAAAPK
jgi:serine/threonine protein kinase